MWASSCSPQPRPTLPRPSRCAGWKGKKGTKIPPSTPLWASANKSGNICRPAETGANIEALKYEFKKATNLVAKKNPAGGKGPSAWVLQPLGDFLSEEKCEKISGHADFVAGAKDFVVTTSGQWAAKDAVEQVAIDHAASMGELRFAFAMKSNGHGTAVPTGIVLYNPKQLLVPASGHLAFK